MTKLSLTAEQQNAADRIISWACTHPYGKHMTLGGLAGTGKTTLVGFICDRLRAAGMVPVIGAPTGKAAHVLQGKGMCARTLHSLIYAFIGKDKNKKPVFDFVGLDDADEDGVPLLIADEASMVSATMHADIKRTGVPVLYVGDYGQLPPIGEDPGIMSRPDVTLVEIHRQAADNPIIKLAHHMREGRPARHWDAPSDDRVTVRPVGDYDEEFHHNVLLCGLNRSRTMLNRHYLGVRDDIDLARETLSEGDQFDAICLKNDRRVSLCNGMVGRMKVVETFANPMLISGEFSPDGEDRTIRLYADLSAMYGGEPKHWREATPFDLAYALTTHKSQGSEWDRVTVWDQAFGTEQDKNRWRYTAATRAKEALCWLT